METPQACLTEAAVTGFTAFTGFRPSNAENCRAGQESLQRQVREIAGQKVVKAVKAVSPQRQGRCSSNACDIEHFESFSLKHTIA